MNNSLFAAVPWVSTQENTAKKQRFSRTAFGFPIRIDAKAYLQGVSGDFPSWVRTQRAPAYVRRQLFSGHLPTICHTNAIPAGTECAGYGKCCAQVSHVLSTAWHCVRFALPSWCAYGSLAVHLGVTCTFMALMGYNGGTNVLIGFGSFVAGLWLVGRSTSITWVKCNYVY